MSFAIFLSISPLHGSQSALNPVGPDAAREEHLWLLCLYICMVVFVLVWLFLSYALAKRRAGDPNSLDPILDTEAADRKAKPIVALAIVVTVLVLFFVLVETVIASKDDTQAETSKNPVSIQVIGHQWWWEIRYPNPDASQTIITANEIHVPVGVPIVINTSSRDVIHSFWVPNVKGKRDLIPGYSTAFWFRVDRPGIYRGQCAEFCGMEHAKMAFYLVAEPVDKFQQWEQEQLKPAPEPSTSEAQHGRDVFLRNACVMCHTIRGTIAGSRVGPDLTHVASRVSLAAGTIPNNVGNLGAWIADSQHIKPGNRMPPNPLAADDLTALLSYMGTLK